MSLDDWLLALHVLSAFALVAGIVFFWVLIVALRRTDTPEETIRFGLPSSLAEGAIGVGALGTIGLGTWLAFSVGGYDVWDGWIIAAYVLWLAAMGFGQRANAAYAPAISRAVELRDAGQEDSSDELRALNRTTTGVLMHTLVSVATLLVLIDMIWKPGA